MQFTVAFAALVPVAFAAPAPQYTTFPTINMTEIYNCGGRPFLASDYTCFENQYLCPVIDDRRTVACGEACYDPVAFGCNNGQLEQVANGAYLNGTVANITAASRSSYGGDNVTLVTVPYGRRRS